MSFAAKSASSSSQMDPITSAVNQLKGFGKASQDWINGIVRRREKSARRSPIEILKRLQREAFSDLTKLRDRQEKVERALSFYKTVKGSPFQEASTHVRGNVDVSGAVLMMGNVDQHIGDALLRAGIRTGTTSMLAFETAIGEKDSLVAEFLTSQNKAYLDDFSGVPLSLAKVFYRAHVSDWISTIAIPVGGQGRDIAMATGPSHRDKGLTDVSSFGPPLLNQHNGSAIGLTVKKSNVITSLAQFVSGLGMGTGSDIVRYCFSTFGQIVCQLPRGTSLSILGLLQVPKSMNQHVHLGTLTIPIRYSKGDGSHEASTSTFGRDTGDYIAPSGSIALMLETQVDEEARIGGWIEVNQSHPKCLQWAVSMSDTSEDSPGWGMSLSGMTGGTTNLDHFQVESYVKLNLGKRFRLKPGVAYIKDGSSKMMALMVRSNWSL